MLIMNGEITDEGYRLILSLVGGKMMDNGIYVLLMARSDFEPEDKAIMMNKFAKFYGCFFEQTIDKMVNSYFSASCEEHA